MVIGPKIYYFYPRFKYSIEYSNLLKIIPKIRNILYYYWFFIAHRSPNYRSLLSALRSHGSNVHVEWQHCPWVEKTFYGMQKLKSVVEVTSEEFLNTLAQ